MKSRGNGNLRLVACNLPYPWPGAMIHARASSVSRVYGWPEESSRPFSCETSGTLLPLVSTFLALLQIRRLVFVSIALDIMLTIVYT